MERNTVPCNGCQACCKGQRIIMRPEDEGRFYIVEPTRKGYGPIEFMLAHKPNGDCIYLNETGCTIHREAPKACREFDCREWFKPFDPEQKLIVLSSALDGPTARAALARMQS